MDYGNNKTSDPHRLLLNLSDQMIKKEVINMLLCQILAYTMHGKIRKSHIKTINLKYQLYNGMKYLSYLMGLILYQLFNTILNIS